MEVLWIVAAAVWLLMYLWPLYYLSHIALHAKRQTALLEQIVKRGQ